MPKKKPPQPAPSTSKAGSRDELMSDEIVPSTSGESMDLANFPLFPSLGSIPPISPDFTPESGSTSSVTAQRSSPTPDDRTTDDSYEPRSPASSSGSPIPGRSRNFSRRRRATRAIFDACRTLPNSSPVKGESYCDCPKQGRDLKCTCGEEDDVFDWIWDTKQIHSACEVMENGQTVIFHKNYSSGTAIARGTEPMTDRQYFWEVKMTSPVYGTDMMVGVGTENVNLGAFRHAFTSMIGRDGESWGLSYYGRIQHKGEFQDVFGAKFGQGTILGVHVDMWHGTVSYYKNRQPLGVAYSGLAGKTLYPMVASTAARTAMKVIKACSFQTSLQFLCCQVLRKLVPSDLNVISALQLPPGLRAFLDNNLSWLLRPCELSRGSAGSQSVSAPARAVKRLWNESESSEESETESTSEDESLEGTSTGPLRPKRARKRGPRQTST